MWELVICHSRKKNPWNLVRLVALKYQSHPQCKYTWGEGLMLVISSIPISQSSRRQHSFPYLCLEFLKENVRMLQAKRGNSFGFGFLWWWRILVNIVWRFWFRIWVHFSWCSALKLGEKMYNPLTRMFTRHWTHNKNAGERKEKKIYGIWV